MGRLPSDTIQVMGRLQLGERVIVEDFDTHVRQRAVCVATDIPDSQATFSRVRLDSSDTPLVRHFRTLMAMFVDWWKDPWGSVWDE
jgi:hypothetical protein